MDEVHFEYDTTSCAYPNGMEVERVYLLPCIPLVDELGDSHLKVQTAFCQSLM